MVYYRKFKNPFLFCTCYTTLTVVPVHSNLKLHIQAMTMANDQVIRVAIADDHMMFRRGIAELLNHAPAFEVVAEAGNGRELIDMIGRLSDQPDVCLLDINMPVQD